MYRQNDDYFDWLCSLVRVREQTLHWYEILWVLANYDFVAVHPMDENRIADALDLRCEFWNGRGQERLFKKEPASVLEVLIALARRGERDVMFDPELGDRSYVWFWIMMENLGLDKYAYYGALNSRKNREKVNEILDIFVGRRYDRAGHGGIFLAKTSAVNMKKEELWTQMNYFFEEFF